MNGVGIEGYFGPQPRVGHGVHRCYFWVYALDINVDGNPSAEEFLREYGSHIIEQNRFVAIYSR